MATARCTWTAVSGVDGYNVYLKSNGEFVKQNSELVTATVYDIENLEDGDYEAYATSVLNDVESDASNVKGFEVSAADPYAPVHGNEFTWGGFTYKVIVQDYGGGNTLAWLDRNLGASQVATSKTDSDSYGHLYQWGRLTDGHQIRTSGTTETLSTTDEPGHGDFILSSGDWRDPQNNNLWQGVDGINNPVPPGWRLPTEAEWATERGSWNTQNPDGAFGSPLKLPMAGRRLRDTGALADVADRGLYWSATVSGDFARASGFRQANNDAGESSWWRAQGNSVRCVRDMGAS